MTKVLREFPDVKVLVSENLSQILVSFGIALTVIGILIFSLNTSLVAIAAVYSGISLILVGLLKKVGLLTFDTDRFGKAGSLLILASALLVTGAIVSLLKIDVIRMWVPGMGAANPLHHNYHFQEANPFIGYFVPFLAVGSTFAALGLLFKRYAHPRV